MKTVAGLLRWKVLVAGWRGLRGSGTASMTVGQLARLGTQALYFILAARSLGPAEYGSFAAAAAIAGVAAPFANWGAGEILLQKVSRSRGAFTGEWGRALHTIGWFGFVAAAIIGLVALQWIPTIPLVLIVCVAAAEFWFAGLVATAANAFQAVEDFKHAAGAWLVLSVARLTAAAVIIPWIEHPTASHWGIVYLLSSGVAAWIVTRSVKRRIGPPGKRSSTDRVRGLEFALSHSSASLSTEVGKISLSRFDLLSVTGAYAAADRIVGVVSVPILAVLYSSYPALHRAGLEGMRAAVALCLPLLSMALLYAFAAALGLYFCAPLIDDILGAGYQAAIAPCQILAGLMILRTLTFFAANCLTATNRQRWRSGLQLAGAALAAVLAFALVHDYSWRGVAAAALVSETALASALWIVVLAVAAVERRAGAGT